MLVIEKKKKVENWLYCEMIDERGQIKWWKSMLSILKIELYLIQKPKRFKNLFYSDFF